MNEILFSRLVVFRRSIRRGLGHESGDTNGRSLQTDMASDSIWQLQKGCLAISDMSGNLDTSSPPSQALRGNVSGVTGHFRLDLKPRYWCLVISGPNPKWLKFLRQYLAFHLFNKQ